MSPHEQQPRRERMQHLQMEAMKRVPVMDYLRLRYTHGEMRDTGEYIQIDATEATVQSVTNNPKYSVAEHISRTSIFRAIVSGIPLQKFLTTREEFLKAEIESITERGGTFQSIDFKEGMGEDVRKRLEILVSDMNLTKRVDAAANLKPSSVT